MKLLKQINGSEYCKKRSIMLLQGVAYGFDKGVEFLDDFKNYDNFIFWPTQHHRYADKLLSYLPAEAVAVFA